MKKSIIVFVLLFAMPSLCLGEVYQIHIAAHGNKPDGDIVSIRPDATATTGGRKSRKQYLFVRVDIAGSTEQGAKGREQRAQSAERRAVGAWREAGQDIDGSPWDRA